MLIAHRHLTVIGPSGEIEVAVRLFRPEEDAGMWICRYEIDWPSQERSHFAAGIDAIQAIFLALQMVGIELYTSTYHKSGFLKWSEQSQGYGFPVARNVRDLLIGDDIDL